MDPLDLFFAEDPKWTIINMILRSLGFLPKNDLENNTSRKNKKIKRPERESAFLLSTSLDTRLGVRARMNWCLGSCGTKQFTAQKDEKRMAFLWCMRWLDTGTRIRRSGISCLGFPIVYMARNLVPE